MRAIIGQVLARARDSGPGRRRGHVRSFLSQPALARLQALLSGY
jgi:hypothetical protein